MAEPSGQLLMIVGRAVGQQGCEVGQELVLAEVEVPGTLVVGRMRAGGIPGLWKRAVETAGGPEEFDAAVGRMLDHVVDIAGSRKGCPRYRAVVGDVRGGRAAMGMTKTPVEIDDDALAAAAQVLGTTTKKDTVNAALREVSARLLRLRALEQLGAMADQGDFDELLDGKDSYRR